MLYDLYPYVWDLRNTALMAKAFICWLGKRKQEDAVVDTVQSICSPSSRNLKVLGATLLSQVLEGVSPLICKASSVLDYVWRVVGS